VYTSYLLLTFRLAVTLVKIITETIIVCFSELQTSSPLKVWLIVHMVLDVGYLGLVLARIPYVKRVREGEEVQEACFIQVGLRLVALLYVVWLLPGNIWYWGCSSCYEDAPSLTSLVLALIILGYLYLLIPALLLVCVCACLPISIIFLMFISNSAQQPATENMIRGLDPVKYNSSLHRGEPSCSICACDYQEAESIIVLSCDERHFFHEECIKRWLRINANCPICRAPFLDN